MIYIKEKYVTAGTSHYLVLKCLHIPVLTRCGPRALPDVIKMTNQNQNPGIKPLQKLIDKLQEELQKLLKLLLTPEEWQVHLIQRVKQWDDSIFLAGAGYGKSLVFEGLAVIRGQRKVTIVISPLKLFQKDQIPELIKDQIEWYLL